MNTIASCTTQIINGPACRFRIMPAGLFRANDGRPEGLPGWIMDHDAAQRIITTAAALHGDMVIDYEHQTLTAQTNAGGAPAAGWFKSMQWIEGDGLYVTDARWVSRAEAMITAKEYRYISPVFTFGQSGQVVGLHSLALTNNPALDGLTDLAAASRLLPNQPPQSINAKDHATLQQIFGENYTQDIASLKAEEQAALTTNMPPNGINSADHHKLQHFFGRDYTKGIFNTR